MQRIIPAPAVTTLDRPHLLDRAHLETAALYVLVCLLWGAIIATALNALP